MEVLRHHISRLAKELEFEALSELSDNQGDFFFPVDEDSDAILREDHKGIHLSCEICPLPQKNLEEFLTHALQGNLFGQGTEGATLGLGSSGKKLTLSMDLDYNIEYEEFKENLEDFVNTVELWKDEVAAFEK